MEAFYETVFDAFRQTLPSFNGRLQTLSTPDD